MSESVCYERLFYHWWCFKKSLFVYLSGTLPFIMATRVIFRQAIGINQSGSREKTTYWSISLNTETNGLETLIEIINNVGKSRLGPGQFQQKKLSLRLSNTANLNRMRYCRRQRGGEGCHIVIYIKSTNQVQKFNVNFPEVGKVSIHLKPNWLEDQTGREAS